MCIHGNKYVHTRTHAQTHVSLKLHDYITMTKKIIQGHRNTVGTAPATRKTQSACIHTHTKPQSDASL